MDVPLPQRRVALADLDDPDLTWEIVAGWQRRRLDRAAWRRLIPTMSYGDLLYRLRHFDAAGVPFETAMAVAQRLTDPAEILASGVLPLRFLAARRAVADMSATRVDPPVFRGLSDASFAGIPLIEAARRGHWPF